MKEKIEIDHLSGKQIAVFVLIILALAILIVLMLNISINHLNLSFFAPSWIIAAGITIVDGISEFSGKTVSHSIYSKDLLNGLLSMIIFFIICPTIILAIWRYNKLHGIHLSKLKFVLIMTVFSAATLLTFMILLISGAGGFISNSVFNNIKKSQYTESLKDQLVSVLWDVSFEASEKAVLPKELGGGSGSFGTFDAQADSFSKLLIEDLKSVEGLDERYTFSFDPASNDSSWIINATLTDKNEFGDNITAKARSEINNRINISISLLD